MEENALTNRQIIAQIQRDLSMGSISYAEAKELALPVVESVNKRAREIAKKYGQKPRLVSVASLLR